METIGGVPIECLTGRLAGVWSGWRILGDREVVREASAKGTHIDLAQKCLASRRHCSVDDAQVYFYREVDVWIEELLNKQQVHRASHILNNVGKNAKEYITSICLKCKDSKLRGYLVQHLLKINGLEQTHVEAWNIINYMSKYEIKYSVQDSQISNKSIEEIMQLPDDIKTVLYTDLYFHTFEPEICDKLENIVTWKYLLTNNEIDLLRLWIDTNYGSHVVERESIEKDKLEKARKVFEKLKITEEMIEYIETSNAATIIKNMALNHLCRYGVFTKKERLNTKLILARLFDNKIIPSEFERILSQKYCNINSQDFIQKMNISLYSKSFLEENRIQDTDTKNQKLYNALDNMCVALSSDTLESGICSTIQHISDDVNDYLNRNPLISFVLIFLQYKKKLGTLVQNEDGTMSVKRTNLEEIFANEEGLSIGNHTISKGVLQNTMQYLINLKQVIVNDTKTVDITMYQLLNCYNQMDATQIFKWRQTSGEMPNFSNKYLMKKYGHKEKLTYINYLKEGRPNMAASVLRQQQEKFHGGISSKMKHQASVDAHICGLRNLDNPEIMSACVSFIEIIGVDSENLRLHLTAAEHVHTELKSTTIGNLLEMVIYKNQKELRSVISQLERSFAACLTKTLGAETTEFVSALKEWDLVVRFARAHDTSLPNIFLKYLAKENLWFEFILVGHIFAYPIDQMLENARHFSNLNIQEHLLISLNNSNLLRASSGISADRKIKSRDSRKALYSKIGLKNNHDSRTSSPSSISSGISSSPESYPSSLDAMPSNWNTFSITNDLWMTILKCHQSQDPPGALLTAAQSNMSPVLTVFATCYEPSSAAAYWSSWLVISTHNEDFAADYQECLDHQIWPAGKVLQLIENLVSLGYINSLSRSLKIFMPENPLCPFMEFLVQCVNLGEFATSQSHLRAFKTSCSTLKGNKKISWDEMDQTYLKNAYWITSAAVKCIMIALAESFQSTSSVIRFLEALCKCDFNADLPVNAPDFHHLLELTKILSNTNVMLDFSSFTITDNSCNFDIEIQRCISDLAQSEDYKSALQLCKIAQINCSDIIIAQWRSGFNKNIDKNGNVDPDFWKRCANDFEKYCVSHEKATQFYVEHAERVVSHKERHEILKLASDTLRGSTADRQIIDTVEMAMWKSCILAGPETMEIENTNNIFNKSKTELMSGLEELQVSCELTEPEEKIAVEKLIDRFIDMGNLDTALRIGAIFNFKHRDLQVLMLCLSLAEDEISPYQLTAQQRMLLSTTNKNRHQLHSTYRSRGLQRISSVSSLNLSSPNLNVSDSAEVIETAVSVIDKQDKIDCILLLERLVETLRHGTNSGRRVLLCYRLAVHLERSYQTLLTLSDPLKFLQEVIQNDYNCKLEIINDIVIAYDIKNDQVAELLSDKILTNITRLVEGGADQLMAIWGYPLDASFHLILELCSEPSLLGMKLLDAATLLLGRSHGQKRDVVKLKVIVELLIRSHDCFTASCNMEGIASILRKSQHLANSLQNLKQWGLLVRLLTGVGRFTEMNYIFQILKENEQFEFLLGRGLDKISGLKMALLEFLKRQCPENKELFKLVALHFRLYNEMALLWEHEAKSAINEIVAEAKIDCKYMPYSAQVEIKLSKTEITENRLQLAMINLTHATEYYLQDNKLNLAYQSSHQAELVALQISFLNAAAQNQKVVCILNLDVAEIDKIICYDLGFSQANILVRAYNHIVDWAGPIYVHCVLAGKSKYLKEFMASNMLTVTIVEDCAKRFQLEKSITKQMAENMQMLVSLLTDVECKYKLASQLGFKKIIETMLGNSVISAYLKDTIWRKGYNSAAFM